MDDLNKAFNHLFGFKVPIDDYDEFEKKVEEAREIKEHLDKVEILKDIPQIVTPVKMTNYDRIKSMSVEEMAFNLAKIQSDTLKQLFPDIVITNQTMKQQCAVCKQWLLQEVSEDVNK